MTARPHPQRAGIIAAGRGDRLRAASSTLKPLVRVGGRTLVERVLESISETAPAEVVVIINEESTAVRDHVSSLKWPFELRWIVETTPSSMHSFLRVVETLAQSEIRDPQSEMFLISTVDTVAPSGAYAEFLADARRTGADVALALTAPASDDTPLRVALDGNAVTAIGDAAGASKYATAGYYAVRPTILREAAEARRQNLSALRVFLARLLANGYTIAGIPVSASIDVDNPADVAAAEQLVRQVRG